MTDVVVLALMAGGMLGWGLMLDRLLVTASPPTERIARALIIGFGMLGWLAFFPALFQHLEIPVLAAVPGTGLVGLWLLHRLEWRQAEPFTAWTWAVAALIAALAFGDFLEGLSPPADADSMAYHFATPKLFLKNRGMFFIPRASDGAAPLLPQMTYMLALGLGGERALTLWCMLTGWLLPLATYAYGRRHLDRDWSLALAATVMSLPTILYSAGTGQVEVRTATFCLVAAFAASDTLRGAGWRTALLAGLAAGLFVGAKYTGLLFAASVGSILLLGGPGRIARTTAFGLAVLVAGGQWYGWHWWNTGDPVYPMLFGKIPYLPGVPWTEAQDAYMKQNFFVNEQVLPKSVWWWLAYAPLVLVDDGGGTFEAGRVGAGPLPLLLLPFALLGAWRFRHRLHESALAPLAAIALGYYTLWFFLGTSQRLRHYVPIVPIILLVMLVAAHRATRNRPSWPALIAALVLGLGMQASAQILMSLNHAKRLINQEDRETFLGRNTPTFMAVKAINQYLGDRGKVLTNRREGIYFFSGPVFYAHADVEARVGLRPDSTDPYRFLAELRTQGVTHVLIGPLPRPDYQIPPGDTFLINLRKLEVAGCASPALSIVTPPLKPSRTLNIAQPNSGYWTLFSINSCPAG